MNPRETFEDAKRIYIALREASDQTSLDDAEVDARVDAYCEAMDRLITEIPAPDIAAVVEKLDLIIERTEGFALFDGYGEALRSDLVRLAG